MSAGRWTPPATRRRQWAVEELSRREYAQAQPGLIERAADWLADQLGRALELARGDLGSPGAALAVGVVAVLLLAVVGYAIWRFGGPGRLRAARAADPLFGERGPLSAVEHRRAAGQARGRRRLGAGGAGVVPRHWFASWRNAPCWPHARAGPRVR